MEKIDYQRDSSYVIRRVFDRGRLEDIAELLWTYPLPLIKKTLLQADCLPDNAIYLAAAIFGLKREDFKCYTSKQYHPLF